MSTFTIFPAIDLKSGKCVRLLQGRADAETVYGDDPPAMARAWEEQGAQALHIVDLDGAFSGHSAQHELVGRIIQAVDIPVQVGGGIRSDSEIERMLSHGATRVILGTRAWADPDALERLIGLYGDEIAVGIDARNGLVQIHGWTETTGVKALDLAKRASDFGCRTLIVTDTATDGMLQGPNVRVIGEICDAVKCNVIASGGVSSPEDVKALRALKKKNLIGAIVGKALYDGKTTLREMNRAAA
jgi:phosphoribosylformimino-5-aminoimidazole carboxamide ribotide isomerase